MSDETTPTVTSPEVEAFNEARAGFEHQGIDLKQYSASRQVAADSMGLRYGYVSADDVMQKTGKYSGAVSDTIIVLWLCSIPNASEVVIPKDANREERHAAATQWTVQRATRNPDAANEAAIEWAAERGITGNLSEGFTQAFPVVLRILNGEIVSRFEIQTDAAPTGEDEPAGNESAPPAAQSEALV